MRDILSTENVKAMAHAVSVSRKQMSAILSSLSIKLSLKVDGVAIVCDACVERYGDNIEGAIIYLMDGGQRRIAVPPVEGRILHEHDLSRHPEIL